jgi:spore maturation protein CgeB
MRWLVAQPGPDWSVHDVHVGWCEALRGLGETVVEFNLNDRLAVLANALVQVGEPDDEGRTKLRRAFDHEQAAQVAVDGLASALWKVRPDVLLVVSGFFADHQMLEHARRNHGVRVVVLHTEQPYELERELDLAAHADLNLINDPTHLDRFQATAPTVYAPHAYRPSVHHPGAPVADQEADLAFVGTGFGSRRWFLEQMHDAGHLDGIETHLHGNWMHLPDDSPLRKYIAADDPGRCLDNPAAAEVYRSMRCGINLYRREAEHDTVTAGWSMGPREVEMAACGAFFLRDPRAEGDRVLSMLPTFTSPDEAGALLRWYLDRPDLRRALADAACAAVADRTFTASATQLLGLLGRQTAAT